MIQKAIGKRIQELRKAQGLTQEQLAERINISPHYLSALERGVYNIKLDLLTDIMNTLNCSADEVFCDVVNKSFKVKSSHLHISPLAAAGWQAVGRRVEMGGGYNFPGS